MGPVVINTAEIGLLILCRPLLQSAELPSEAYCAHQNKMGEKKTRPTEKDPESVFALRCRNLLRVQIFTRVLLYLARRTNVYVVLGKAQKVEWTQTTAT